MISCVHHFYPRSHVGNDSIAVEWFLTVDYFYPRSHVGNDVVFSDFQLHGHISIHVPT